MCLRHVQPLISFFPLVISIASSSSSFVAQSIDRVPTDRATSGTDAEEKASRRRESYCRPNATHRHSDFQIQGEMLCPSV